MLRLGVDTYVVQTNHPPVGRRLQFPPRSRPLGIPFPPHPHPHHHSYLLA